MLYWTIHKTYAIDVGPPAIPDLQVANDPGRQNVHELHVPEYMRAPGIVSLKIVLTIPDTRYH